MTYIPSEYSAPDLNPVFGKLASTLALGGNSNELLSKIPFNRLFTIGKELEYISKAIASGHIAGDGEFTKQCQNWLKHRIGCQLALMTHSCTAALEMAAILADIQPGDEVIMPSYTFVSTANAFVLRGAVPVFVDIRPDTLNIDETKVEAAITSKTKAIVPVHYAGVSCEMDVLRTIADQHHLWLIEDAAQGILSQYKGKPVGSVGHLAALSFHETKNIVSGEGGAILINDDRLVERAEIIREKGTNRSKFFRGEVDKYTWVDVGSSYLPSDILTAFLWAQLEDADYIIKRRHEIWQSYHHAFAEIEQKQLVRRPVIPAECEHNAHIYYLLVPDLSIRTALIAHLKSKNIHTTFHYVPLHNSPAGLKYGRTSGNLAVTEQLSDRIVRLPVGANMSLQEAERVSLEVLDFIQRQS